MTQNQSLSINYAKINVLTELICYRLDDLFEKLNVDLHHSGKMYIGCCPIHCGDNYSALNLYPEGDTVPGIWRCNTRHCERVFGRNIVGFVRGVLSQRYFNWSCEHPKSGIAPYQKVINWLCKFVGKSWSEIKIDERTAELNRFANQIQIFKGFFVKTSGTPRSTVRQRLQIPATYYIERKYKAETLDSFDVGLCVTADKKMCGRVVVPFYDDTGKYMVGCTARSTYNKCKSCSLYHNPKSKCPSKSNSRYYSKWRHFGNPGSALYNWWNAKQYIKDSATVVLVESPGNVWRLWEVGVKNVVAMFGSNLTDEQQIILERSGAMKLVLLLDNDEAGKIGVRIIKESLARMYQISVPDINYHIYNDLGDMLPEYVVHNVLPYIN